MHATRQPAPQLSSGAEYSLSLGHETRGVGGSSLPPRHVGTRFVDARRHEHDWGRPSAASYHREQPTDDLPARVERALQRIGAARSSCARRAQGTAVSGVGKAAEEAREAAVGGLVQGEAREASHRSLWSSQSCTTRAAPRLLSQADTEHLCTASPVVEPAVRTSCRVKRLQRSRAL